MGYRDVLNAIHKSYEYIPIHSSYVLQLHRDLYIYSGKKIGARYKNRKNIIEETNVDVTKVVHFMSLAPYETSEAIESFNQVIDSCVNTNIYQ